MKIDNVVEMAIDGIRRTTPAHSRTLSRALGEGIRFGQSFSTKILSKNPFYMITHAPIVYQQNTIADLEINMLGPMAGTGNENTYQTSRLRLTQEEQEIPNTRMITPTSRDRLEGELFLSLFSFNQQYIIPHFNHLAKIQLNGRRQILVEDYLGTSAEEFEYYSQNSEKGSYFVPRIDTISLKEKYYGPGIVPLCIFNELQNLIQVFGRIPIPNEDNPLLKMFQDDSQEN